METGANVVPLPNGHGELVKNDKEKAKALSVAFTSGFASRTRLWESLAPETHGKNLISSFTPIFSYCP